MKVTIPGPGGDFTGHMEITFSSCESDSLPCFEVWLKGPKNNPGGIMTQAYSIDEVLKDARELVSEHESPSKDENIKARLVVEGTRTARLKG